ncbi:MAG: HAD family hydrolase [Anaerolineaceae bacterium]
MTIKAVIFDMGGTIETFSSTHELRLAAIADIAGILQKGGIDLGLNNEDLLLVVEQGIKRYHEYCLESLIEYSPARVWNEFVFDRLNVDTDKVNSIAEALAVFVENRFYERHVRPEVPGVLKAIQEMGLKIGLISNVNSHDQVPENLVKYGIIDYFDPIVLSSNYGIRKPDPSIFHYAARLMNVPTSQCVYVGDRISRDIIGSKKAGYKLAIQIEHDFAHGEKDEGAVPDSVIQNMAELLPIIKHELGTKQPLPASHIRAFLFDAGDILYYRPGKKNDFDSFLAKLGIDNKKPNAETEALTRQAFTGEIDQDQYFLSYLKLLGIQDAHLINEGKRILEGDNSDVKFFEGVRDTLLGLKRNGYLLGIITNTANSLHTKLQWFEKGGFAQVWDSIISSKEVSLEKPHPDIYLASLTQLGITADQAVFVGHRKIELDGAKAVGISTIGFNYDNDVSADILITNFAELLHLPEVFSVDR